jgi:D-amino peptidase
MKTYMVRCDIEGVTGVVSYEQAEPGKCEYALGQRMFMSDLLACVHGLREGGADRVVIYDMHYYGRNIDLAQLPDYASAICGKPAYRKDWAGGLDKSFAGMVLLGLHSKADTPGGLLPHSYELEVADLRLNGASVGEIGMEAAIAGDCGVPTLLVAGDSAGASEAKALLPGVACAVVKESLGPSGALCYPQPVTAGMIFRAAADVARHPPAVKPYRVGRKVKLEVRIRPGEYLDAVGDLFKREMSRNDTLVLKGATATEVWAKYLVRKFQAQEHLRRAEECEIPF